MNETNENPSRSPLERLSELKNKFETFLSADKLEELRHQFAETIEHAQSSLAQRVDKEVKQSLKQTSSFIESQKKELEGFQKKINTLLLKFAAKKKKTAKKSAKKTTAKKAAPKKAKKSAKKRG